MTKFILGKKLNMTQGFGDDGKVSPATLIEATPLTVTQVKNAEKDGYGAVQVGYGERKERNVNKAQKGHYAKAGSPSKAGTSYEGTIEFRMDNSELNVGDKVSVESFEPGDEVAVSGISKAKGFQGGVKRHGFHGGPRSHGQKHSEREVGSIGATDPARVFRGKRMPGRMGGERVTVKNLKVLHVDPSENKMLVSGAIPGRRGTLVEVVSK